MSAARINRLKVGESVTFEKNGQTVTVTRQPAGAFTDSNFDVFDRDGYRCTCKTAGEVAEIASLVLA